MPDRKILVSSTDSIVFGDRSSAAIKAAIAAASSGDTLPFFGTYNLSDWGTTPYVIDKELTFWAMDGGSVFNGDASYLLKLFDIRAPVRFVGFKFNQWGSVFEFNAVSGSKLEYAEFDNCKFYDCVRCVYSPDTYSAAETIGLKRLVVDRCYFKHSNLTLDNPGLGARASDGERCIEISCPVDSTEITNNYGEDIKKALVIVGFTGDDAEAVNWNKFNASKNVIRTVRSGESTSTNNASGIIFFGKDAVCEGNRIDNVQCADGDEATGIFVFCESASIYGNKLHNCGGHDAAISIKGDTRAGGTVNPPGYRIQITQNSITYDDSFTAALPVSGGLPTVARGIWCQQEDVIIAENIFDRCTGSAIHLVGGVNGIKTTICNNIITNHRMQDTSDAAVHLNAGSDLNFFGNVIESTPQTVSGTPIAARVVRIQPDGTGARSNWNFYQNTLRVTGGGSSSRGFMVVASSDISNLSFDSNRFFGMQQGIRFDTGTISFVVAHNNFFETGMNEPINLTVVPTRYIFRNNPGRSPVGITFADGDTDPSVLSYDDGIYYATAYTGNTAIGRFDGETNTNGKGIEDGTIINIYMGNNTFFRIQHNSSIKNLSGAAITSGQENRVFRYQKWGGSGTRVWLQIGAQSGSAANA